MQSPIIPAVFKFFGSFSPARWSGRIVRGKVRDNLETEVFGLKFPHPVGLGAGFDHNGDLFTTLSDFGFSFVEVGPLSPLPQPGNRHSQSNKGIQYAIQQAQKAHSRESVLAFDIIKNGESVTDEDIARDYLTAFSLAYDFADLFILNFQRPSLDTLRNPERFKAVVDPILEARLAYETYKPILIKLSPDLTPEQMDDAVDYCRLYGVDGVVAGSVANIKHIAEHTEGRFPIIGYGGIRSTADADEMLKAGASLLEITTGMHYAGPALVRRIIKHLNKCQNKE